MYTAAFNLMDDLDLVAEFIKDLDLASINAYK